MDRRLLKGFSYENYRPYKVTQIAGYPCKHTYYGLSLRCFRRCNHTGTF